MATTIVARAPKEISPLLRTARWVAIFTGVFYGRHMQKKYSAMELEAQKYEKPIIERAALMKAYHNEVKISKQMNEVAIQGNLPGRMEQPKMPVLVKN